MQEENLTLLKERFRQDLEISNKSQRTINNYLWSLERFLNYLSELHIYSVLEVNKNVVLNYQKHLHYYINKKGKSDTPESQNKHLQAVKMFFHFLKEKDYIPQDPSQDIAYAKQPITLPRSILTKKEAKKMLQQPNTNTPLGFRNRTILELLYSTGIRRDELRNLTVEDVNLQDGYLRINSGKGNVDRVIPVGAIALKYLQNYILEIRPILTNNSNRKELFISRKGSKLGKNTPGLLIEKYAKLAKIEKTITPHTWRHTCATHMLQNNANIRHVQELLGHRSLESTQRYTQLTIIDLKQTHKKHHPREKDDF